MRSVQYFLCAVEETGAAKLEGGLMMRVGFRYFQKAGVFKEVCEVEQ